MCGKRDNGRASGVAGTSRVGQATGTAMALMSEDKCVDGDSDSVFGIVEDNAPDGGAGAGDTTGKIDWSNPRRQVSKNWGRRYRCAPVKSTRVGSVNTRD
jgi:hypothetical protein